MYLPPELLDQIINCVPADDKRTLCALCLCSSVLYSVTARYLFRSLRLSHCLQTIHVMRLLHSKPRLAQHVHSLALVLHGADEVRLRRAGRLFQPAHARLIFRTIRAMRHLRSLSFSDSRSEILCRCCANLSGLSLPLRRLALPLAFPCRLLLESLPELEEVDLPHQEPSYALDTLSSSALPNITSVRLVRNAIVYFVPARPVEQLTIIGIITPDELGIFLSPLGRSTGPLRRLSLHVFKVDTGFYEEVAACVPFIVDLVAWSEIEDHAKMLSHLKKDACIEAFREMPYLHTLELHGSSVGRVVTSVQALPLIQLMAAAPYLVSVVLVNEKDPDRQEVERYHIDEERGNVQGGFWVRDVEVTTRQEFIARRGLS